MSMLKNAIALCALGMGFGAAAFAAEGPRLGEPISEGDLAPWDITVMPDGTGLPSGSGTASQGAPIFAQKCAACHGNEGEGGIATPLTAGPPRATLDGGKSIANFWPYATTVFDFIRRAMPPNAPSMLTDEEAYALTAYVLYLNALIGEDDVIDQETLPEIEMPNRDNFITRFPERI
jgi:cytochrome c553